MTRLLVTDRQEERRTQERMRSRIANKIAKDMATELNGLARQVASAFEEMGGEAVEFYADKRRASLAGLVEASHRRGAEALGGRLIRAVAERRGDDRLMRGSIVPHIKQGDSDHRDAFEQRLQAWIAAYTAAKVTQIDDSTRQFLRGVITAARDEGLPPEKIAKRIRTRMAAARGYRAMRIARTEAHSAAQAGQSLAAQESTVTLEKEWIASIDDRTRDDRFDHARADGEVVAKGDPFTRTGEPLQYPGDPSGSAGNIIHCRCGQGFITD